MTQQNKKINYGIIIAMYLAGIFMGALDTGIVTPARTIIQNSLMVNEKTGIWMITIYTLAYAASIPIMGKLADKYGRKYIYLLSILLFGLGSLFCGLSQEFGSFTVLLIARVVQAIGGGGIIPVATAEFGTSFPPEKRGVALGLVGGVYGIANIFGASAGSAIMDVFGKDNWQFIFYINIPITLFILAAGLIFLQNNRSENVRKNDYWGIILLTAMVLSLLYGIRNIDFFDFFNTLSSTKVYPFLILFILILPFFIIVEKKAEDPIMNLRYFTNQNILVTLLISFVAGTVMMGMIFVPQFSENSLKIASGSGGYLVIILGLFAGAGAPFSGKLIDKFGVRIILTAGFIISALGSLFLIFITANSPSLITVILSLVIIGLGLGFTVGTPLNYMMLENTKKEEANSALAALSLIRSIGTTIAPAIMIGFIAHAGANIQSNVMNLFPRQVSLPELPYASELTESFKKLKEDPQMKAMIGDFDMPDLMSMTTMEINMSDDSNYEMSNDMIELMKSSDVTTIVKNSKTLAKGMFDIMTPEIIKNIQNGLETGIEGMSEELEKLKTASEQMKQGHNGMGMSAPMNSMAVAASNIDNIINMMNVLKNAVPEAFETAENNYLTEIDAISGQLEEEFQMTLNEGFKQVYLTVVAASLLALLILAFYKKSRWK